MKFPGCLSVHFLIPIVCLVLGNTASTYGANPVKLSVYFETLCSDSKNFYVDQLFPVWQDLQDIMEMDINVYGKIEETTTETGYSFDCQHGEAECRGNKMMLCAKKLWTEEEFLKFGNCIMEAFIGSVAGQLCAEAIGKEYGPIEDCWEAEGDELLHQEGLKQATLDPALDYVPWILIDDVFTRDQLDAAQQDLKKVICDAYQGEKPDTC